MYKIAIPSFNRSEIITQKTLKTLQRFNVAIELIHIFVVESEYDDYCKSAIDYNIIVGQKGLINQRRFMESYFDEGECIVYIDDDFVDFDFCGKSFDEFIIEAFHTCINNNASIFSVYPCYNKFFREKQQYMTTDLRFISGGFYGCINRPIEYTLPNDMKEDFERTLQYFIRDQKVVRFNQYGFKTNNYSVGGCGNFKSRLLSNEQSVDHLVEKYGDFGQRRIRKNKMNEFVLHRFKSESIPSPIKQWKVNPICFEKLEELLKIHKIPWKSAAGYDDKNRSKNGRCGFPRYRGAVYGLCKRKIGGSIGLSYQSKAQTELYDELVRVGRQICSFPFTSIQVNNNLICPKHKDANNVGDSLLVSVGKYKGCNIVINCDNIETEYDTLYSPVVFNGSQFEHHNTPLISGDKWSLVYFSIELK
jgi:hypothetical protein